LGEELLTVVESHYQFYLKLLVDRVVIKEGFVVEEWGNE